MLFGGNTVFTPGTRRLAFTLLATLNTLDRWYDANGPVKPEALVAEIETLLMHGFMDSRENSRINP